MIARRALLCSLAGVAAACGSDSPPRGPIAAGVTHYDYTFDVASRAAHASVTATVTTAGDCWTLPLRAQPGASFELDHAAVASATIDATTLTACGAGYEAGETLVLDADVTVPLAVSPGLQAGYSTKTDAQGRTFSYLLSWIGGCDRFGPCDSEPGKFATYHFDVTHDAGTTVRCPGDIDDVSPTETVCDFPYDGGPTYSTFGIAAYTGWTQSDLGTWGDVHVTLYDRADTGIAARIDTAYHAGYMQWLESQFGPYPYGGEMRLLTAPTVFAGFEHPGNIVLLDTLAKVPTPLADYVQHTITHELGHTWAGNQTTVADVGSFVWKEATVEYLAATWEDMHDATVAQKTRGTWKRDSVTPAPAYYPVPLEHPPIEEFWGDVYGPGPMILFRQVEVMSSREQVLAALHDVLGTPRALSIDELVAALVAHTSISKAYFTAWLEGTGAPVWPKLDVTYTPGSGATSTLALHLTNPTPMPRGCKFHVALDGANTGETVLVAVDTYANGSEQTLQVQTPSFAVAGVRLDPDNECLVFPGITSPRAFSPQSDLR